MPSKRKWPKRGLLICALESNGSVRITIDDIAHQNDDSTQWIIDCFVTSKDYDPKKFDDQHFDDKELANFGHYILSRLYAFKKRGEL